MHTCPEAYYRLWEVKERHRGAKAFCVSLENELIKPVCKYMSTRKVLLLKYCPVWNLEIVETFGVNQPPSVEMCPAVK